MGTPAEMEQKWLDALRSGEYKQTRGMWGERVFSDDGNDDVIAVRAHCCLNVALVVAGYDKGFYSEALKSLGTAPILNGTFAVLVDMGDGIATCQRWNDTCNLTFHEIADRLEAAIQARKD